MKFTSILIGGLGLAITAAASAQRKTLEAGDAAPGLDVETWVGGAEQKIEEGFVFVVLFWEAASARTMSGNTAKVFSHLGELAEYHVPDKLRVMGRSRALIPRVAEHVGSWTPASVSTCVFRASGVPPWRPSGAPRAPRT